MGRELDAYVLVFLSIWVAYNTRTYKKWDGEAFSVLHPARHRRDVEEAAIPFFSGGQPSL